MGALDKGMDTILRKFQGISLRWKINLMGVFIVLIFSIIVYFMILPYVEKEKIEERKGKLKAVVNSTVSLIDFYEGALRKQGWDPDPTMPRTVEEAKRLIIKNLREMRYDKTEYFFILDGNGNMVMHPTKPELEGKNMLDVKDPEGVALFKDLVVNSQRDGEAFASYVWQSKYSPAILEPQTTYAKYFWQWDWVICTGLYTQDIVDAMNAIKIRSGLYNFVTAAVTMALLLLFVYVSLSRPLRRLLLGIQEIHDGNLDHRIDTSSHDEIGYISQEFNLMVSDLKTSRDNIIKSESKYRELTDMLPDIIYETDMNMKISYLNKAGHKMTGYSDEDVKRGLSIKDLIVESDYGQLYKKISKDQTFLSTHKIIKKDGSYFIGEDNTVLILDNSVPTGLRGSIRDVTDKLQMEEQLLQSQKMETIGTLAGGLAHDFNNVLAGITGTLSIMKFELNKNQQISAERLKKHMDMMERSGQRAVDMVQQLLTLSRKQKTMFAPVDLGLAIKNVIKICKNTFDKAIEIKVDIPADRSMVSADPTQLEQILLNLCVNASHAMTIMRPEGQAHGGKLEIAFDKLWADERFCLAHPEAKQIDYWRLSARDTGIGMDSKTIAKIFVPFFTTKEKGKGTGLGLSMVYNLVKQHNGFIDVYSEIGLGTTFNVFLPVLYRDGIDIEKEKEAEIPCGEGLILVVDDEEVMRHIARSILEKCGYQVIVAENGEEGVKVFQARHAEIKAVLLDMVMPVKSGDVAFLEMKKIDPQIKALLSSGFKQDERVTAVLTAGIGGFIQKPYTMEKLAQTMDNLLKNDLETEKVEEAGLGGKVVK